MQRSWSQYCRANSRQTASATRPATIRGQRLPKGARFASGAFMGRPYPLTAEVVSGAGALAGENAANLSAQPRSLSGTIATRRATEA